MMKQMENLHHHRLTINQKNRLFIRTVGTVRRTYFSQTVPFAGCVLRQIEHTQRKCIRQLQAQDNTASYIEKNNMLDIRMNIAEDIDKNIEYVRGSR